MRLLVDTNVILDVLLARESRSGASSGVWQQIELGGAEGYLAAHAVPTIYYLLAKELGAKRALESVAAILGVFRVAGVDDDVLREAVQTGLSDFEDAVTAIAAKRSRCEFVVSRDAKGFRSSPVTAITPEAALAHLRR